jgi:hypothetical protein
VDGNDDLGLGVYENPETSCIIMLHSGQWKIMIFLIQFVGADELELGGFGGNEEGTHDLGLASSNPKK